MKKYYYVGSPWSEANGLVYYFTVDEDSAEYKWLSSSLSANFIPEQPPELRFICGYDPDTHKFSLPKYTASVFLQEMATIRDRIKVVYPYEPETYADKLGKDHFLSNLEKYVIKVID